MPKGLPASQGDIDLALVFDHIDQSGVFDEAFDIFHEAQQLNPLLEPICFTKEEFEDELTPVVLEIKNTGIELLKSYEN